MANEGVVLVNGVWAALIAYLLGAIPFGLLLTRAAGLGDVRTIGSGNIGATNVLRTGNKGLAAATLLLDMAKGYVAVAVAGALFPEWTGVAAVFAVLGHCFPAWLRFKGGKGVATNAGVSFALGWPIGLAYALVWLGLLAATRISSVAGMGAVVAAAVVAAISGRAQFLVPLALIALLVIALHRANIRRLMTGTEPRLGARKAGG